MRQWLPPTTAALMLIGAAAPALAAPATPAAPAPATVNGAPLSRAEFDKMVDQTKAQYTQRYGVDFTTDKGKQIEREMREGLLNQMIEKQLVLNEANKRKIQIAPEQVDEKLADIKKNFGTENDFTRALATNNLTLPELRGNIQESLRLKATVDAISPDVAIGDKEAKQYYEQNPTQFDRPEQVRVRHLLVKEKAEAEKLLADLKGGADFATLVKEHSLDTGSKEQGGDLGLFQRGRMVPEFEQAAFALKPGELSGLVQTQYGFHILQGIEHQDAKHLSFEEAQPELQSKLGRERKEKNFNGWLEQQKKQAKVVYAPGFAPQPAKADPAPKGKPAPTAKGKPASKGK